MTDKRVVFRILGAAVAVGILLGASPSIFAAAADFKRGLMGEAPGGAQLSAAAATPVLQRPLSADEQQELEQGLLYVVKDQPADAAPILGKYAMLGEPNAQMQIGALYYFGKGVPLNRDEGIRWLRLAAAQGSAYGQEALSAALSGTWAWENSGAASSAAYADGSSAPGGIAGLAPQYGDPGSGQRLNSEAPPSQQFSYNDPPQGSVASDLMPPSATSEPANAGAINIRSGQYMAPAGPSGYVDPRNGTFYASSGPDGVVNTRTGEYSPVSH